MNSVKADYNHALCWIHDSHFVEHRALMDDPFYHPTIHTDVRSVCVLSRWYINTEEREPEQLKLKRRGQSSVAFCVKQGSDLGGSNYEQTSRFILDLFTRNCYLLLLLENSSESFDLGEIA